MKWTSNRLKLKNLHGQSRIVKKFLWIPRRFQGEYAWLEEAYIMERVRDIAGPNSRNYQWVEIDFSTEELFVANFNIETGESMPTRFNTFSSECIEACDAP